MTHTILVAEDSDSMRAMVSHVLRTAGYVVIEAVDGEHALRMARVYRIQAVVTDQDMPNLDGLSLVRSLRKMEAYATVPIVMLTNDASAEMKQLGREAGASAWMGKPFDPDKLVQVFAKLLG